MSRQKTHFERYQTRFESEEIDTFIACIDFTGLSFDTHLHRHIEYHMVEKGQQHYTLDGRGGILYPGDFLLIFPYQHHSFDESNCFAHFGVVNLDIVSCYHKIFLDCFSPNPVIRGSESITHIQPLVRYIENIKTINNTHQVKKSDYNYSNDIERNTLHSAIRAMVGEALKNMPLSASDAANKNFSSFDTTSAVINYCRQNYDKEISLSSVAKALFLNKDSVSRIFSKNIGISFNSFINELRIVKACSLLSESDKNIVDIAFECGFKNQGTFNAAFKAFTKMTPREYKSFSIYNFYVEDIW